MMKTFNKNMVKALGVAALGVMTLASCDDSYDTLPLEYKEDPNFAPPQIENDWNLVEISDLVDNSRVYAYKDKLYDELFTRNLGWNGGDGGLTTLLPDGNVYWTFNDSFYGVVEPETRTRRNCSFPRNSVMIQTKGEDGLPGVTDENLVWMNQFINTTDPNASGYYCAKTFQEHPMAVSYNDHGIAQDFVYWAGDATVVGNQLQMLWMGVDTRDGDGDGIGDLIPVGTAFATYSLDGQPGDESYMKLLSIDHNFKPENKYSYGSTILEDEDGHIYLYSTYNGNWLDNRAIVARTTTNDLNSEWEYYVVDELGQFQWQKEYPSDNVMLYSKISSETLSMPWVIKKGDWYYMIAQSFPYGNEMRILRSEHPWGPFEDGKILFHLPKQLDKLGDTTTFHWYMINLHPALSREGELVFSTNSEIISPLGFFDNFNAVGSADYYRLFFFRVFKWERMYD